MTPSSNADPFGAARVARPYAKTAGQSSNPCKAAVSVSRGARYDQNGTLTDAGGRMTKRGHWVVGAVVGVALVIAVVLLWPAPDPLAGVRTVALRVGDEPASPSVVDLEAELRIVLGDHDIQIVSDEESADAVLALTAARLNLGNVEMNFASGRISARASAVCRIINVRTGRSHVMDFRVVAANGEVRADLVPRRFWEFWKPRPEA